ncbi:MAG TPA: hypothetical protein VHZ51_21095 [Ktedonobacteraceae bacterium]|nr:hypothetical protein [Ktedonobacteraceae bacterium]
MADIKLSPDATKEATRNAQGQYFRATDQVPQELWYWASLASIIGSALLFVGGKRDWGLFVGQWPPAFLLFGLYHKLLHPSTTLR